MKQALVTEKISLGVAFWAATMVGKYNGYPKVDETIFERVHRSLKGPLSKLGDVERGDFCQELVAMISCPAAELMKPEPPIACDGIAGQLDEIELRLISIADVMRRHASLEQGQFKELLVALLSWKDKDRLVVYETFKAIVQCEAT